jgi:hypothetical protein
MTEEHQAHDTAPEHKHAPAHKKVRFNPGALKIYLLVILLVVLGFSLYALFGIKSGLDNIPAPVPPHVNRLTLTVLEAPNCDTCARADNFAQALAQLPLVNVTTVTLARDSIDGQKLIKDHKITRLPAAVVTGETENVTIPGFEKQGAAYVFTGSPPPYYDLTKAGIVGLVEVTYITDKSCKECFDITRFGSQMKQAGITVSSERALDFADKEAQELIKNHAITAIPTLLLSPDALEYEIVAQAWPQVGTQEADGTLVLRNATPPYRDLGSRKVRGLATITYLVDPDCAECYNVSTHRLILESSFSIKFKTEKTVDVRTDAGKKTLSTYGVTKVPAYLLDEEAAAYSALVNAWEQVGTRHKDGTFVFSKIDLLGGITYKDLSTGKLVNVTESE